MIRDKFHTGAPSNTWLAEPTCTAPLHSRPEVQNARPLVSETGATVGEYRTTLRPDYVLVATISAPPGTDHRVVLQSRWVSLLRWLCHVGEPTA